MKIIFSCNFISLFFYHLFLSYTCLVVSFSCFSLRCTISSEVNYTSKYVCAYITTPWSSTYNKELQKPSDLFFHARWTSNGQMQHSPGSRIIFMTLLPSTPPSFSLFAQMSLFLYTSIKALHFATVLKTSMKEKGAVTQQQTFRVLTCMNEVQNRDSPTEPTPCLPSCQDWWYHREHHYPGTTLKERRGQEPDLVLAHHEQ